MHIATLAPSTEGWYTKWMPPPKWNIWVNHAAQIGVVPNQERIFLQHSHLTKFLWELPTTQVLELPFPNSKDPIISDNAVFVRDAFLSNQNDKVLISRFRNPTRINQTTVIAQMVRSKLQELSIEREMIVPPNEEDLYFEWGDFRFSPNDQLLFVWYNPDNKTSRNSESWIQWVQKELNIPDKNRILVHSKGFHIDTVMWLVTDFNARVIACLACPDLISNYDELNKRCESSDIQMIPVGRRYGIGTPWCQERWLGTINTLNINDYLLSGWVFDEKTEEILNTLNIKRWILDVSEFWLAGWWIHCLTNQI